ncbi:helix-turn-helix transcriptional regulator [Modestobacter versicolor]|uniref:helix-turn-helix transcriptional regulator n=1 Tax=Modestobacter versicolor TaxID=429133 RepID=UPI0034DF72DF
MAHRGPFVGRAAELADLREAVADARAGSGAVLLVAGPAGIGKTRLVEEAVAGVPDAVPVRWGRAVDDPGAPPLWVWRRVLQDLPGADVAADAGAGAGTDQEAARFRFVTAVTDALLTEADPEGLVVVLEDLHWADGTSLRLLRHLAGEVPRSRVLVVGTSRGSPAPGPLAGAPARSLVLGPLSEPQVGEYLAAVGVPAASGPAVQVAHRRSGGNPLYLRALARQALRPGRPPAADGDGELRHLVRTTLAGLPAEVRELVAVAAVVGEEVDAGVLAAVTGTPVPVVTGQLDAAGRAGVLTTVPGTPGRRRFVHAVVRDGVYADLAPGLREELHRRTARALEDAGATDLLTAGPVAGHWLRGATDPGSLRRAARWARRASAAATRSIAFDEATRFLRLAQEALARAGAGAGETAELLVELAAAEFRAGRFAQALRHAEEATDLAAGCGRADLVAAAALTVHDVASPGIPAVVARLSERALAVVTGPGTDAVRARLLAQLAAALAEDGAVHRADELSAEALGLAERCGDPTATVDAVRARMKCAPDDLDPAERLRLGRTAVALGQATGQPLVTLWGHKWRIDVALQLGTMAAVDGELAQVAALAEATRLPLVRWHDLRLRASVEALRGRFDAALELNDRASELARGDLVEDRSALGMSHAFLLQLALVTGDTARWDDDMGRTLAGAPPSPIVQVSRALHPLLLGQREAAAARYAELRGQVAEPGFASMVHGVPIDLVPLVEAFGDRETAAFLLGHLAERPFVSGGAGIYCSEPCDLYLGRLAAVLGRRDDAVRWFRRGVEVAAAAGARPAVVQCRLGLAAALAGSGTDRVSTDRVGTDRVGTDRDLGVAATAARQALEEGDRLGMPGPAAAAGALLARLRADARARDPLTGREAEVADLVAAALTNRQIADRLVLSERTVESHVRSVLAKLGLANRTEIATSRLRRRAPEG